jgi:hypothetical protein
LLMGAIFCAGGGARTMATFAAIDVTTKRE